MFLYWHPSREDIWLEDDDDDNGDNDAVWFPAISFSTMPYSCFGVSLFCQFVWRSLPSVTCIW